MNTAKTYNEFFKAIFSEIQLVDNDKVEDIQKFKSDFYNLILGKLQIDALYKTHFKFKRELTENDIKFLKAFFSFITGGSDTKDESKDSNYVRGAGKKTNRKNGRDILNGIVELYDEELLSLYQSFYDSLDENEKLNYKLEYNSIYSEAFKRQAKKKLKKIADDMLEKISTLPAPYFSCLIMNLAPSIKPLISNINQILNKLEEYENAYYIGYDENDDLSAIIQRIQNTVVNTQLSLSDSDKSIKREINATKEKAFYRSSKKKITELSEKLNSNIAAENKDLLTMVGLAPEKFQYQDNFSTDTRTLYNLANTIYSNSTEDLPDVVIKFKNSNKME